MKSDDIHDEIERHFMAMNAAGRLAFEGYSPIEMDSILYDPYQSSSTIVLRDVSPEVYTEVPLYSAVHYLLQRVADEGSIRLTEKGHLSVKVVADLYQQGFMKEREIELGISKLYKERDSMFIHLTQIMMDLGRFTKKRKKRLELTKKGKECLSNPSLLFKRLLLTYTQRFNWGYFDGYESPNIGMLGHAYSLILLLKYGDKPRNASFYASRYFVAFPKLADQMKAPGYCSPKEYMQRCYAVRTLARFMSVFGFVPPTVYHALFPLEIDIQKTPVVEKLFHVVPPANPPQKKK